MRFIISLALIAALFASAFAVEIPDSFDARDKWPKCITPILNQGQCGSCWSFSASTSMSARFCIATNGTFKAQTVLSPQYLINCDTDDQGGCQGGDTLAAYNFMKMSGQDTLNCTKYVSGETTEAGSCPTTCDDGRTIDNKQLFFGVDAYSLVVPGDNAATVQRMQEELMKNGPLSVSFLVYQDFIPFFKQNPKGIYTRTTGRALGGHAVRLVGWGEENKQKYWIIANSWGPEFGFDGYFKIARGVDLATIESRRVTAGIPRVNADVKPVLRDGVKSLIIDGGKVKVPVDDEILEIAKFSLSEMNQKKNGPDAFYGVDEVFAQVTNGITYHLKLSVGNASRRKFDSVAEPELISVVVHRNHNDKLTLKSL